MNRLLGLGIFAGAAMLPAALLADSISPSSVIATLPQGGSVTVTKTVTVNKGTPTTSKVDVFFMADTTGSMYGTIAAVKASASTILSSTAGLGDVQFAVGEYKDIGDVYEYRLNKTMTSVQADAQAGINMWSASGGGDWEEAELQALKNAAGAGTGWRTGSAKILVWFGDAPGHDPSGSSGTSEAQATAALQAKSIKVEAIDVGSMNYYGQASRIASATGGAYYSGIDSSSIVAAIQNAIVSSFDKYSTVSLDLSEVPAGVTVTATPGSYSGTYDRSIDRTFTFNMTITGDTAGTYGFNVYGAVDGAQVATEADRITVEKKDGIPDAGSSVALLGLALLGLRGLRRFVA